MEIDLKAIQKKSLEMLIEIDRICKENHLIYYIQFGTLLGAIRHKGFIPWDDDIDIMIPRKDYQKFIKIFNEQCGKDFFLQNTDTDKGYPYPYAKVRRNDTIFVERKLRNCDMHHGIYVDVFPLENVKAPETKMDYFQYNASQALTSILMIQCNAEFEFKRKIKPLLLLMTYLPKKWIIWLNDKILNIYNNQETKYYFPITSVTEGVTKLVSPKAWYGDPIEIEFEGIKFYGPCKPIELLTKNYGDYMQLPPEGQRVTDHDIVEFKI